MELIAIEITSNLTGIAKIEEEDYQHCSGSHSSERETSVCTSRESGTEDQAEGG